CSYCYNAALQDIYGCRGRAFTRKKSPERVLTDIEDLVGRSVVRAIYFIDDLFTDDKDWLLRFCDLYPKRFDIPFMCNITADSVDEDKVRALADAGCRAVLMGVETGNERLRIEVLNKVVTDEQILEAVGLFRKYGIKFLTYTMLGLPGETLDDLLQTVRFNQRLRPNYVRVTVAFPMPHTEMTERAVRDGLIARERLDEVFSLPPKDQYTTSIYQSDAAFMRKVRRLYHLFPFAVRFRLPVWLVRWLIAVPFWAPLLKWLHYFTVLWEEKGVFRITLASGLRFFWHTGHPLNKTKNANNFVP
ncbi:MAG TPA: radical SAM protein, partial [Proteobacteria bacterium]|nr:radical SAM protein [Pseudomonadota bacterium]